jgi:hypothetical protein
MVFVAVYATLGTIDLVLMLRYSRKELQPAPEGAAAETDQPIPAMLY